MSAIAKAKNNTVGPDPDETVRVRAILPDDSLPPAEPAGSGPWTKSINIQQRGRVSSVRVKLSLAGGLRGSSKWSVLQRGRVSAVRVELSLDPALALAGMPRLQAPDGTSPAATTPGSVLWVVLERARRPLYKGLRAKKKLKEKDKVTP